MAANIEDTISIDTKYLFSLLQPNFPWGTQQPHDPRDGVFVLADTIQRQIPTSFNPITHESIHPSVLMQSAIPPQLANALAAHPDLITQLMPLEQQAKQQWPSTSSEHSRSCATGVIKVEVTNEVLDVVDRQSFIARAVGSLGTLRRARRGDKIVQTRVTGVLVEQAESTASSSQTAGEKGWLLRLKHETSLGVFIPI